MKLLILILLAAMTTAQAPQSARVQGTITDLQSGRPLPNALVSLFGSAMPIRAVTDAAGRFAIESIPAGEYNVSVSQDGYLWSKKDSGPSTVTLKAGPDTRELSIRMLKASAISGVVLDENRQPVRTSVSLMRLDYRSGRRGFIPASGGSGFRSIALTNRNGEYRLYGLEPGEYYLRVTTNGTFYYPGVANPSLALPVTVQPGREAVADFKVGAVRAHTITVSLSAPVTTPAIFPIPIDVSRWEIQPRDSRATVDFNSPISSRFTALGNNRFRSPPLPAGAYDLVFSNVSALMFGRLPFDVKDRDEDLGTLQVSPGISLQGQLRISNPQPEDALPIQINLAATDGTQFIRTAGIQPSGLIDFRNVPEGRYWVNFTGMPAWAYVQSIRYGAVPSGDADIAIGTAPEGSVEIVLARSATLKGTVKNGRGATVPESFVAIFPSRDRKQSPSLFKSFQTEDGTFSLQGLAPGEYRALAWDDALPKFVRDPDFLATLEPRATRFTILGESAVTIEVQSLGTSEY